jgi:hypothetical protein
MSIVLDKQLEHIREFEKDVHWYNENYDDLYNKYKNEYVAIKRPKVYNAKDADKLLKILDENNIDVAHTFIEFINDRNATYT